jgi:hypothetical protein
VGEAGGAALVQAFRGARDLAGSSPMRSRSVMTLMVAITVRRSFAAAGAHDQVAAGVVELHFELVDRVVVGHDLVGPGRVADAEAVQRFLELGFHHAAHQQDLRADRFQLLVVLFR